MENNELKWIVYCTTNIVNNFIYIGVHKLIKENPDEDSYIGCGCYATQPCTYNNPKTRFQYAVKEFGPKKFVRRVLRTFNNENDAYFLEAVIVNEDFLARKDVYNMVLGGKGGVFGRKNPTFQYDLNGNFIKSYDSIYDAAISMNRNARTIWRGLHEKIKAADYFWSDKKYDLLDTSLYKTEEVNRGLPIYQYSDCGEYECCYESIRGCARVIGVSDANLGLAVKLGTKCNGKYYSTEFAPNFSIAKSEKIKNTTVYQYSLSGEFIQAWESANKARKELGFTSDIYKAIKLGRTAGEYQWSLEPLPYMEPEKPKAGKARRIGKYDKSGNLIKEYDTLESCKKENGSGLIHVLKGRDKQHKGFVYKYLD